MSRNVSDHQKHKQAMTELRALARGQTQTRTLQKLGSQSIRLAVVEGYLFIPIDQTPGWPEDFGSVEIEAPEDSTILVGSLLYSSYLVTYNTWAGGTGDVDPLDTSNAGWGGVVWNVWLPYAIPEDDPAYTEAQYFRDVLGHQMPPNRIRIGARITLQQGSWTTSELAMVVMYQLRMTIGRNE